MKLALLLLSVLFFFQSQADQKNFSDEMCSYHSKHSRYKPNIFRELFELEGLTPSEIYVAKLYTHLTGTSLAKTHPRFRRAVSLVDQGKRLEAARFIVDEGNFLKIRVRNLAAPLSNRAGSYQEPLNDMQALIIGVARDELDARLILTGNIRYSGYTNLGLPAPSRLNNDHYANFENLGYDLERDLEMVNDQWADLEKGAGIFTTRAWGRAHYDGGTNRRALQMSFENFLCAPIESWKARALPDYFVRRDVHRAIEDNPFVYQNHCRNCHAPMDAMGGAFAYFDFSAEGALIFDETKVAAKMNQNGNVYPEGYVTTDASWSNLLTLTTGARFGWRGKTQGSDIQSFAGMLANSSAYSRCWAGRVFREVCGRSLPEAQANVLAVDFETHAYNLKYLFSKIASLNECITY